MTEAKPNPFDISPDTQPLPKTDSKVVETPEDKVGTKQDKPAKPKTKKPVARRTKEEKLQDDLDAARKLLAEHEGESQSENYDETNAESVDFNSVDFEKYPLSAVSGTVSGVVKLSNGAVPILEISLIGWVGDAPLSIRAEEITDVESVLRQLRKLV